MPDTSRQILTALGAVAIALLLASTSTLASAAPPPSAAKKAKVTRLLSDPAIVESSGLARSTYKRPLLWTHNDKGDSARVFAIDKLGNTKAVLRLTCATNVDWEDISSGPDHTIWVGDIGNDRSRTVVPVYRFTEPQVVESGRVECTRFELRFPGEPRNAEALLVHPTSGRIWLVTKQTDGAGIFRAPATLSATSPNRLKRVGGAPAMVTAGSWTPNGKKLALSTLTHAYIFRKAGLERIRSLRLPEVEQGESLEYTRDGSGLLWGSEGSSSPIYRIPLG